MAQKSKQLFKFITGDILASDTISSHHIYGINIEQQDCNEIVPETKFKASKIEPNWWNITPDKNHGCYGMVGLIYTTANMGRKTGDGYCDYKQCLYLPSFHNMTSVSSISGAKRPYGSAYPALIDFDVVSFISTLLSYKRLATKSGVTLSNTYKQHLIKSTSSILAKYITRLDTVYLNPLDYQFYDVKTGKLVNMTPPDETIFRPFTSGYQVSKQSLLRQWYNFRYFGSNLMLPQFNANEIKKQAYLKSLVADNEEIINVIPFTYDNLDEEIRYKYILSKCLGDYYDWNDKKQFTIDGTTYELDIENECFKDLDGNVLPNIVKYKSDGNVDYILSFKDYKELLVLTYTDADKKIQQDVVNALKNNTDLPSSQNVNLNLKKWNGYFYLDTDKLGNYNLWWGKYKITYDHYYATSYITEYGTDGGDSGTTYPVYETIKETLELSFDEMRDIYNTIINRKSSDSSWVTSPDKINKPMNIKEAIVYELYPKMSGSYTEPYTTYTDTNPVYFYQQWHTQDDSDGGAGHVYGWGPTDGSMDYFTYLIETNTATNISIAERTLFTGHFLYEYTDGSYSLSIDNNKVLKKRYTNYEVLLELFGPITVTENIDKTDADYDGIDTYFHEMYYTKGNVWDTVDIQPIFVIKGVTQTNNTQKETSNLTAVKVKYDTEDKLNTLTQNEQDDLYTDDNGVKYDIELRGKKYDPPVTTEVNTYDDDGNIVETRQKQIEYGEDPEISSVKNPYTELIKFSLPHRQLKIYSLLSNHIKQFKANTLTGYLLIYKDRNDGIIKCRKLTKKDDDGNEVEINGMEYLQATSDLVYDIVKCLPLVPLYNSTCVIDPFIQSKICVPGPEVYLASLAFVWLGAWAVAAFMAPFIAICLAFSSKYKVGFLGWKISEGSGLWDKPITNAHRYYYYYDKKVNLYYKNAFNWHLKEWEKILNNNYTDDEFVSSEGKTVKVKMSKKVPRRFTNENCVTYVKGILDEPEQNVQDYTTYANNHTHFGAHTSIRFSFTIYFNMHFRKTRLIARMGFQYLDWFYKKLNGEYGVWIEQYLYPPDRIQFPEKLKTIRFCKVKYDRSVEGNEASYYVVFKPIDAQFIFYKRSKSEKIIFSIDKYIPDWRNVYFSGKNTYSSKPFSDKTTQEKLDSMAITKNDLIPRKYTDIIALNSKYTPVTKYTKSAEEYTYNIEGVYYGEPLSITYKNTSGTYTTKSVNIWSKANNNEYACFYKPHELDSANYKFDENLSSKTLSSFETRDCYTYLQNLIKNKPLSAVKDMYKTVFNKDIEIVYSLGEIFNYDNVFDNLSISNVDEEKFKSSDEDQIQSSYTFNEVQHYNASTFSYFQSYYLNYTYDPVCLISTTEIDMENKKSITVAAREIAYYLLTESGELSLNKYLSPSDWESMFIGYNQDGLLAKLFSSYEIYNIGFNNYLVTDDISKDELTLLLERISEIDKKFIYNLDDLKNGNIKYNAVWLPLPVDIYKRFPIYCKNLVSSLFLMLETYNVSATASVRESSINLLKAYTAISIINAIGMAVVSIIVAVYCPPAGAAMIAATILIVTASIIMIIAYLIQLVSMFLPTNNSRKLRGIAQGMTYAATVLNIIGSIISLGAGAASSISALQIATMVVKSIDYALQIAETIVLKNYEKKKAKETARLNVAIENYNKSQEELWEFIEQNEFEGLLNTYQPININAIEASVYDDKYDTFVESFTENSILGLYEAVDDYYYNRLG